MATTTDVPFQFPWFEQRKFTKTNVPFTPFSHHTWRGVTVSPNFLSLSLANIFFNVCCLFLHGFVWCTHLCYSTANAGQQKIALLVQKQFTVTITYPPCMMVKMEATAIVLTQWSNRPNSLFLVPWFRLVPCHVKVQYLPSDYYKQILHLTLGNIWNMLPILPYHDKWTQLTCLANLIYYLEMVKEDEIYLIKSSCS